MGWTVILQCDGPTGGHCPYLSGDEGLPGKSVKNVSADARQRGWNQIDGRWRCAKCVRDIGLSK